MNRLSQRLARMAAFVVGPALAATLMFSGVSRQTPWRDALEAVLIACVFSLWIRPARAVGRPAGAMVVPRVGARVRHLARPSYWTAMVASMMALAAAGSLVALLLLAAAGRLNIRQVFAEWFGNSLRISVIVTLTVGTLITMF